MNPLILTAQQRKKLERLRKATLDRRIYQRLTAVLVVAAAHYSQEEVAHLLGVGPSQLSEWLLLFRSQGLDALCSLADDEPNPTND
jgi:transcriptional regulator with XRE-family HTH domain